ncbi:MAG: hypothetical protein V3U60_06930 [Gammaproteobacteria bacterium]
MRFRVLKQFDWCGERYPEGSVVDMHDGHPRLAQMVRSGMIVYDCTIPLPDDLVQSAVPRGEDRRGNPYVSEGRVLERARRQKLYRY